ncbi:pyridoxamine 5'-phosphate oxidase family protein [Pseudoclavibacter sp. 13-3]|uniref:pyridoxamine 5'-phosphate oxidase family protein n=1 Tax=Pseudoclavibacter sp. 13-3 TaxID=2901228 RepID=UPI001E2C606A|nr:pyridoxamine 5'-phosphate oxidase family protein [Pseudoclavibacter sp. 13-3]MCD7100805.1 pyridoxamine 5'-phosphate oxidase family protein [Pseudoclavibacter sp. 13-3]
MEENTVITRVREDEAWQLFAANTLGHLGFIVNDAPEVLPVNYAVHDRTILFRTAPGTKLFGVTANPKVAFQTEQYTETGGWSVVAKGSAEVLTSNSALEAAEQAGLRPWVPTVKENVVRIVVSEIAGRRFAFGPEPEAEPEGAA